MEISELVKIAHANAVAKGFYPEGQKKELGTLLMLVVSELGECLEADRRGKWAIPDEAWYTLDSQTVSQNDKNAWFEKEIKDSVQDEIADVFIRLADMCGYYNIDIDSQIRAKMDYNATREKLHGKKY
jgi:NTP pyrophosphatase (non-canonical NTP hydrolase)